jgi:DNA-binding GntR family transcriptional regulator
MTDTEQQLQSGLLPIEGALSRELLSDKVYTVLRNAILSGAWAPGSRIVESEIARQLSVSQAPAREAMKKLAYEGIVVSIPRRGTYVTEISESEALIGRKLRGMIEELAAHQLAEAGNPEHVRELRSIAEQMVASANTDDRAQLRLLDMDMQFHHTLVSLSGSALLERLWMTLEPSLMSQRVLSDPAYAGSWSAVAKDHVELVEILARGDAEATGEAFRDHATGLRLQT